MNNKKTLKRLIDCPNIETSFVLMLIALNDWGRIVDGEVKARSSAPTFCQSCFQWLQSDDDYYAKEAKTELFRLWKSQKKLIAESWQDLYEESYAPEVEIYLNELQDNIQKMLHVTNSRSFVAKHLKKGGDYSVITFRPHLRTFYEAYAFIIGVTPSFYQSTDSIPQDCLYDSIIIDSTFNNEAEFRQTIEDFMPLLNNDGVLICDVPMSMLRFLPWEWRKEKMADCGLLHSIISYTPSIERSRSRGSAHIDNRYALIVLQKAQKNDCVLFKSKTEEVYTSMEIGYKDMSKTEWSWCPPDYINKKISQHDGYEIVPALRLLNRIDPDRYASAEDIRRFILGHNTGDILKMWNLANCNIFNFTITAHDAEPQGYSDRLVTLNRPALIFKSKNEIHPALFSMDYGEVSLPNKECIAYAIDTKTVDPEYLCLQFYKEYVQEQLQYVEGIGIVDSYSMSQRRALNIDELMSKLYVYIPSEPNSIQKQKKDVYETRDVALQNDLKKFGVNTDSNGCLEIGAVLRLNDQDYTIRQYLDNGGFAKIYLALDAKGNKVAIKELYWKDCHQRHNGYVTLKPKLHSDHHDLEEKLRHQFKEEANRLETISKECPYVPQLLSPVVEFKGTCYYAMTYINGGTLYERVTKNKISGTEVDDIIEKIGKALSIIHNCKMLHLDVTPANIMFQGKEPVLVDFGNARLYDNALSDKLPVTTVMAGTMHYASPELRKRKEVDIRSDVYSFAACAYYMLTGEEPKDRMDLNKMIKEFENSKIAHPDSRAAAIKHALEPNEADRTNSIETFVKSFLKN